MMNRYPPFLLAALLVLGAGYRGCAFAATGVVSKPMRARAVDYDFAAMIQPLPATAKFVDPNYFIWCGSGIKGDDGKYHLFYSRWPREFGFGAWSTHSEVAHAVADSPFGPWVHQDVVLPARGSDYWDGSCTHNPTIVRIGNKYYLYYMGNRGDGVTRLIHRNNQRVGVAVADSPYGPWTRFNHPAVDVSLDPDAPDALLASNPSVAVRPDGGVLMLYKSVGKKIKGPGGGPVTISIATSDSPTGPFTKHSGLAFSAEGVVFAAEDPFIWRGPDRYWAIVKDNWGNFTGYKDAGSLSLWESADGFKWTLAKHPTVATGPMIRWADGRDDPIYQLERPQLLFDEEGNPIALFCAARPGDRNDNNNSNVQIPLSISAVSVERR